MVSCGQCQHFIKDHIGSGDGIGQCKLYIEHIKQHKNAPAIAGRCLWPNALRDCKHYLKAPGQENG